MAMQTREIVIALESRASSLENEAIEIRRCIAILRDGEPSESKPKKKPHRKAALPAKATKTAKAKPTTTKRKAPASDDEPRTVKGRMPKVGVQQIFCETDHDRVAQVAKLKAAGYTRVAPNQPITTGTYDARSTGDGDQSSFVLYREIKQEAGA